MSAPRSDETKRAGWQHASLGKLLPLKYGKSLPANLRDPNGIHPVYGSSGMVGTHAVALTTGPTLIVGRKGNVGAIHYSAVPCWPIDTAYFVETPAGHNLRYYKLLLESLNLARLDRSTAIPGLSRDDYNSVDVSVAPAEQQDAIVAEIEKQFSRLDEAVANLKRVKANLKRYKASVLKDAVEGRLVPTEAELSRCEGRSYETGEKLLQRILEARRRQWNGKGKFKAAMAPAIKGLPVLPVGWTWARLDSVAALKGGITVDAKRVDPKARTVPYLRVANVQRGYLDMSETKRIAASEADIAELRLRFGDILFNEGGDRDKLGRGWIWEDQEFDCIHQNHVFRARVFLPDVAPKLISWWGNSFGKEYFQKVGKQTTNLASINLGKLSEFPIPIPPAAEQLRLVAEIERRFSVVQTVEAEVDANLKRTNALRQATLSKSFKLTYESVPTIF